MGFTDDLLTGLAEDTAQLDGLAWDPDGTSGNILLGPLPGDLANGVGLAAYGLQPDLALADATQPVQFWIRGDDAFVKNVADALFDRHHGAVHRTVAGIDVTLSWLGSDVPMGVDQQGRRERTVNYYFQLLRPTPSRPD